MKTFFKYCGGSYYIGDNCESFLFIKNKDGNNYAFFRDQDKDEIISSQCKIVQFEFKNNSGFNPSFHRFSFVYKIDDTKKIMFEMIAEAFMDFLQRIKCPCPIQASFCFAQNFFQDTPIKYNTNLEVMERAFSYNNTKYSSILLNIYYFLLVALEKDIIFQKMPSKFDNIKTNLQNLIITILYSCSNEIKTINDNYAKVFISKQVMNLESKYRNLFIVAYFLLTGSTIDMRKNKLNLMDYESSDYVMFLKGTLPREQLNCHNFWIFPASLLVCDPHNLFDIEREYKFTKHQNEILDAILNNWINYFSSKKGKLSKWFGKSEKPESLKATFSNKEDQYIEVMEKFYIFLKNAIAFLPPKSRPELGSIKKQLSTLKDSIKNVVEHKSKYAYEDVRTSAESISKLYRSIYLKTKGDFQAFWPQLDSGGLTEKDLYNRETVISYMAKRFG